MQFPRLNQCVIMRMLHRLEPSTPVSSDADSSDLTVEQALLGRMHPLY